MSGYLPPHSKVGPWSEIFKAKYELHPTDITGGSEDVQEYELRIPSDVVPTVNTLIAIHSQGKETKVQPMGFGLWSFGDVLTYGWGPSNGYDQNLNDDSINRAWNVITKQKTPTLIDTAEHYGYTDGYSEKKVGDFLDEDQKNARDDRSKITFATKFFSTPWRHPWKYPDIIRDCASASLERSHMGQIDIYQLHGPSHLGFWPRLETICEGLAQAYETGKVKAIGTCNLSFNQVKCDPWTHGLVDKCPKLGVATIAYSPIALGRLSGKYSGNNPPRGNRNFGDVAWFKIQPIVDELERIGDQVKKTPTAVALNWTICKGAIPIPAVKNEMQAEDCLQALGWRLSKEDEARLDVLGLTNSWDWNILKHFQNWWWEQG